MRRFMIALAALAAVALTGGRADAGYEFRFANASGVEGTSYTIDFNSSTTVDVRVYLVATGAEATTLAAQGLKGYGVQLNYDGSAVAKVLNTSPGITNNAAFTGFDGKTIENDGGLTDFARSTDSIASGTVGSTANGANQRVLLATFRFTGLSNGDAITFSVDPANPGSTILGDNTVLDSMITGQSATITVQNVPEPGTLVLTGLVASGIAGGAVRRIRRKPATV